MSRNISLKPRQSGSGELCSEGARLGMPDLSIAEKFLLTIDPSGVFTFQTFDDQHQRRDLAKVLHGTLDQHAQTLTRLQVQGAGVFFMVNAGDGIVHEGYKTCRCERNVQRIRSLFVDLDGAPLDPVLHDPHPDIVIESSPGRFHAYWLTDDCPLDKFTFRQKQLAAKFNGDKSVTDLPRVMRLPGFWHQKKNPFMTRIVSLGDQK